MGRYSTVHARTGIAATNSISEIVGSAGRRVKITDIIASFSSAPADIQARLTMGRTTTAGTGGTAFTPVPLDAADGACTFTSMAAATSPGTATANAFIWASGINQRATVRWFAPPEGELIIPAVASNGVGILATSVTGGAPDIVLQMYATE